MSENELTDQENSVPLLAVKALKQAQVRARESGRPVVMMDGQNLVRIGPAGRTVLKTLPPRTKVSQRKKRATQ